MAFLYSCARSLTLIALTWVTVLRFHLHPVSCKCEFMRSLISGFWSWAVFQYSAAAHNVLTLATKANYDNCVKTSPLNTTSTGNDALVVKAGGNYFICGIPTHCESGQKVAVNVSAATGTPETPGTPAAPGTPAPQGPSSATSLTVRQTFAAVSVALSASLIIW